MNVKVGYFLPQRTPRGQRSSFFSVVKLLPLFCLWLVLAAPVGGQSEEVSATSFADYAFGQMIRFYLTADSQSQIQAATLFFRAPEFPNTFVQELLVQPGNQVALSFEQDLNQVQLAPFTTVTFWWVLQTAESQDLIIPEQTIVYEDDRFQWRNVAQNNVTVHWTGNDNSLGQIALDVVAESWPRLLALVPTEVSVPLNIYIYPSSADLRAALRLTGRDWVGAHAAPELGVLLVTAVNTRTAATDLRRTLPHEMMHFLLYHATGPGYGQLPVWLNEGLATLVEENPTPTYENLLETAVSDSTLLPFTDLCRAFPSEEDKALLAYAQSLSLVRYLQANYGNQTLRQLVAAYADGADCASGVNRTFPLSLEELTDDWLQAQQPQSSLTQFWRTNRLWLLLFTGSLLFTTLFILHPINRKTTPSPTG